MTTKAIRKRLEYLRRELRAERISYGELADLQALANHIDPSDVELLEAAGVPEFPEPSPIRAGCVDAANRLADLACAMYHPGDSQARQVFPTITWADIIEQCILPLLK